MEASSQQPRFVSVLQDAQSLTDELVRIRRAVHRMPELGFEEWQTQNRVIEYVSKVAPAVSCTPIAGSGVLATLAKGPPAVLLRGCLDALPVQEETEAAYASTIEGRSHACGHDGQVAILLGAVALLARTPPGIAVSALFQPAEEIDTGARAAIDAGVLEMVKPVAALGFHGDPRLGAGAFGVGPGPVMASITTIHATVEGRSGHGAEPNLTNDAVTAAASLVLDWQVALARRIDPRQPVVLSIGRIAGGTTPNVIPGRVDIDGTLRSLDPEIEPLLLRILDDVARGVETRTGARVEVRADRVVPAVVNDPAVATIAAEAVQTVFGEGSVVAAEPTLGGDDFAWYLRQVPGCYVFIGERQPDRGPYGWHDPAYDLDEAALPLGAAALAAIVYRFAEGGLG
jgi:amidohydrolase